jgi:hypothetical protein
MWLLPMLPPPSTSISLPQSHDSIFRPGSVHHQGLKPIVRSRLIPSFIEPQALSVVASRGIATHPGQLKALLKTWHLVALFGRNDILPSYLGGASPPRRVFLAARFLLAGKLLDRPTSIGVTGVLSVFPAGA